MMHPVPRDTLGRDLRCPVCQGKAVDVAPDFPLGDGGPLTFHQNETWVAWKCAAGHENCAYIAAEEAP